MKLYILLFKALRSLYSRAFAASAMLLILCSVAAFAQESAHGVNVGLVYPLSTHGKHAGSYSNIFSLNVIAGVSREEKAFTMAGFANFIREDATGFQVAGFSNFIGGFADGFKGAGFLNMYQSGRGFQVAGFANLAKRDITGMQAAGFINTVRDLNGFQAAGFINIAGGNIHGTQAAGYINIAGDVKGSQFAGFINIAKKVKGVQLAGFINIADSSDYPIGIVNIIKNGEKWLGVTTDDNLTTLLTFRSGGRKLYGIIGVGYNFENTKDVFAMQYGLGAHLVGTGNFRLNAEATAISLENFKRGEFNKFSLSILPAVQLGPLEIFAGPSFNHVNTDTAEGRKLIGHYMWTDTNKDNRLNGLYIGYTAGVQMRF
ncbi:hypothetical protein KK083_28095 [Fulvivirgaceae bacterium PWU4]|uniref:DUF5723 domain-containing protein n=1 Tax=Chryseosolibacter histidini TaxID=2782349 RepID=A0AAP2DQP2_9BACT|nr:hypothetical protein [Chryseosolibacter histidini]MBT1700785.1 hypothetical protein [Chryseosolibacter histidini]